MEKDGIPWNEYQNYMLGEVKKLKTLNSKDVPANIDTKPEKDSKDTGMEKSIKAHQLVADNHDHFVVRHPDGSDFKVAKNGLSAPMVAHIAKMPKVEHDDEGTQPDEYNGIDKTIGDIGRTLGKYVDTDAPPVNSFDGPAAPAPTVDITANSHPGDDEAAASPPPGPDAPVGQQVAPTPSGALPPQQTAAASTPPAAGPDFNQAYLNAIDKSAKMAMGANNDTAAAHTAQASDVQDAANTYNASIKDAQDDYQDRMAVLTNRGDDLYKSVAAGKIDPNRMWSNAGTGSKIGMLASILVSGLGSGLSGQPNMAMGVINKAIDNDIDAQKADLGRKQNLLAYNNAQMRDSQLAYAQTRSDMLNTMRGQIDLAAAKQGGPLAAAAAQSLNAGILANTAGIHHEIAGQQYRMQLAVAGAGAQPSGGTGDPDDIDPRVVQGKEIPGLEGYAGQIPKERYGDVDKELGQFKALKANLQTTENLFNTMRANASFATSSLPAPLQTEPQRKYDIARGQLKEQLTRMEGGRITEFSAANIDKLLPKYGDGEAVYTTGLNAAKDAIKNDAMKTANGFGALRTNRLLGEGNRYITPSSASSAQGRAYK